MYGISFLPSDSREYSITDTHISQLADHKARTVLDQYNPIFPQVAFSLSQER